MAGIYDLPRLIPELLLYREAPFEECEELKEWYHDADLLPRIEHQLRVFLDSFQKYAAGVYDVQGPSDRGSDVLLRFMRQEGAEDPWQFISFQVKSYHDLSRDRYFIKNLRSQYVEASGEFREQLGHYYIVLSTTYEKRELRKLRWIRRAFVKFSNVTVIDPAFLLTFLRMTRGRVNIVVEGFLREEDAVYERALSSVASEPPTRAAVLVALAERITREPCNPFDLQQLEEDRFLIRAYSNVPDYYASAYEDLAEQLAEIGSHDEIHLPVDRRRPMHERITEDVEALVDRVVVPVGEHQYKLDVTDYAAVIALLFDAKARYGYSRASLSDHVFASLGVLDKYGIDYPMALDD